MRRRARRALCLARQRRRTWRSRCRIAGEERRTERSSTPRRCPRDRRGAIGRPRSGNDCLRGNAQRATFTTGWWIARIVGIHASDRRVACGGRPGIHALLEPACCRVVPFGKAGQESPVPDAECIGLVPGRACDWQRFTGPGRVRPRRRRTSRRVGQVHRLPRRGSMPRWTIRRGGPDVAAGRKVACSHSSNDPDLPSAAPETRASEADHSSEV